MKTLLLHPEDSVRRGPWTAEKWDCIVDLGRSSESMAASWRKVTGSAVVRLSAYRKDIDDPRHAGQLLRRGFGVLVDRCGLDWWELTSLAAHSSLETAIALRRLAADIRFEGDLYATRPGWPVSGLVSLLGRDVRSLSDDDRGRISGNLRRLSRSLRRLSRTQIVEILWDKYDADYHWRSRLARDRAPCRNPVVLLPSAYTNVSRAASDYARLLPEQDFLLVATRNSGLRFDRPANVHVAHLAEFAGPGRATTPEFTDLDQRWVGLLEQLAEIPEIELLRATGTITSIPGLIRSGLAVRDAWSRVLEREPVTAVLCGDDSNWFTRIPVFLAKRLDMPTLDFHHGVFDGRFLIKSLSSDMYLAKNEMERDYLVRVCGLPTDRIVVSGLPVAADLERKGPGRGTDILFFSEPYEVASFRPEEVYRELLPPLFQIAVQHGRRMLVKLHPFENAAERTRLLEAALGDGWKGRVDIVAGPLTSGLLDSAWFGVAVESSALVDCVRHNVPSFHCAWLASTSFGYSEQYARFGVGRLLRSRDEVSEIPAMLAEGNVRSSLGALDSPPVPGLLRKLLMRQESPAMSESP